MKEVALASCTFKPPSQRGYNRKRGGPVFNLQKAAPFLPLRKKLRFLSIPHSCCPHCFIQGETARYCAFRQGIKQKTLLNALPEQIHSCPSYAGLPYWPYIFNMFAFPKDVMSSYLTNEARSERLANLTWTLFPIHFLFHSCCGMRLAQRWYLSSLKLLNLFRSQKHQHFFSMPRM